MTATHALDDVVVLFAGDSGDGMQLTGSQFTLATAHARNDLATLPDFPAEIRAPAGTLYGVSGFQLHFGSGPVLTPGDEVDLLVAMNPAALKVNLGRVRPGGAVLVNTNSFGERDLGLAGYESNPLDDGTLAGYERHDVELTRLTHEALAETGLSKQETDRAKNMFALGLALWLYTRPVEPAHDWIRSKFAAVPEIRDANLRALDKGYHYGDVSESFVARYEVAPASLPPGTYRAIRGNEALALGLVAASVKSGLGLFYGTYPITPASDLLHALAKHKSFGVRTFQAEDEIAAVGAAIGAAFGGSLGVTATSGPGMALKAEFMGLATMTELPLVVVDVQRAGPSTGMPTKTEQSDLLMALYGRNGEAPTPVVAPKTPGECFEAAYHAARVALKYMTPVVVLSDGYLGNGSEPWRLPDPDALPPIDVAFADAASAAVSDDGAFLPYVRDEATLARGLGPPGDGRAGAPDRRARKGRADGRRELRSRKPPADDGDAGPEGRADRAGVPPGRGRGRQRGRRRGRRARRRVGLDVWCDQEGGRRRERARAQGGPRAPPVAQPAPARASGGDGAVPARPRPRAQPRPARPRLARAVPRPGPEPRQGPGPPVHRPRGRGGGAGDV